MPGKRGFLPPPEKRVAMRSDALPAPGLERTTIALDFPHGRCQPQRARHDRPDLGPPLRRPVLRPEPARARDRRDQRPRPDIVVCSGDLTTFGFKQEYAQAKRYLDRIECEALRRDPGQPRLAQRRLRPLRGALRRPQLGAADRRRHRRRGRLDRARPRPRPDRARPLPLDRGAVRASPPASCASSSCHHHLLPDPGHRARAERRLRRGRRDRVPAARRRAPRPLRPQARPRTPGGSRTCSSSTPAPSPRCGCAGTRGPVTT